jgi:branched-chain amino acid transport system ATP-binding protein
MVGVTKAFGGVLAVSDCSFRVETASITGLIGPNGAGKSTVVGLISGFLKPDSGSIVLDGAPIGGLSPYQIGRRGVVRTFQQTREWGSLTVIENLLAAAPLKDRHGLAVSFLRPRWLRRLEEGDRVNARRVLMDLGLYELRDELSANLSGGQKRLLDIGRVLMAQPHLALLDEPVAGVNPVLFPTIASALTKLREDGTTVVLVEHNLEFVEDTCDKSIVMALGTTIAHASMEALRADEAVVDAYLGAEAPE